MPYSFTQIERDKSISIGFVFLFLIIFYFLVIAGLAIIIKCFFISLQKNTTILQINTFTFQEWFLICFIGIIGALVHYFLSIINLTQRTLSWIGVIEPDINQGKHKLFLNILDELSVATGGKKFQGVIIPQTSLNAFAIDDDTSLPVIGITEGALHRLSRDQIEAVIAQEAAHILHGDCYRTTIISAMFEFYTLPLQAIRLLSVLDNDRSDDYRIKRPRHRTTGRLNPIFLNFLIIIFIFYLLTKLISTLMRMLISREAKLRADATAIRLTRNPISLAQAIRLMSKNWRGAGSQWDKISNIFFINPIDSSIDEKATLWSHLFSTHPPIQDRINTLLNMAHASPKDLEQSLKIQTQDNALENMPGLESTTRQWFLQKDNEWQGPFTLKDISDIPWLRLDTLSKAWGKDDVKKAQDDPDLKNIAIYKSTNINKNCCPTCKTTLITILYENQELIKCPHCRGLLLNEDQAGLIMANKIVILPKDTLKLAQEINNQYIDQHVDWQKLNKTLRQNNFTCPKCLQKMQTRTFNALYHVPIDKCSSCAYMWFEEGELELLQALYEIKNPSSL